MTFPTLATKLYIPPPRAQRVQRPRLVARLNAGLNAGLNARLSGGLAQSVTLVSAPAGFGKTALISAWAAECNQPVAWLTLDAGDGNPAVFLTYLIAALRTVVPEMGTSVLPVLQSPQPPVQAVLAALINEIAATPQAFTLVLDDYHAVDSPAVDEALAFLISHLPQSLHLVVATREDPSVPLARVRASGRLTELRAADLRFTQPEAAEFLNEVMGLALTADEIAALDARTEGWVAGLQLAALSLEGRSDTGALIRSFSGSHRFVLDYLVEEVLQRQPPHIQDFLLRTSILDRMCGPLCDAVVYGDAAPPLAGAGQEVLSYLARANLFVTPLDNERRWHRYHHLFRDLLRQRLQQSLAAESHVAVYHQRAGRWLEANGLELEAFQQAAAAGDIKTAARLAEGKEMPLHFRGAVAPVLSWLASLPPSVLQTQRGLNVLYASALIYVGRLAEVEDKLHAAEAGLDLAAQDILDERMRNLIGHIAAIRATLAVSQHNGEQIIVQSQRALEYLPQSNEAVRTAMTWSLGYARQLQGDRAAARDAYTAALTASRKIGHFIITLLASLGLGRIQEGDNQLDVAAAAYDHVLQLAGDPALPVACEAHLGLARIRYERNDLEGAQQHAQQAAHLAQQLEATDRLAACTLFAARLRLAGGDLDGAAALAAEAADTVRRHQFTQRTPDVATIQTLILLRRGDLQGALAAAQELPLSRARVLSAMGDATAALALLEPLCQEAETKGWADERLRLMVLQALAFKAQGNEQEALRLLHDMLAAAHPGGLVRLFVDEGAPMAQLLQAAAKRGVMPAYTAALLGALAAEGQKPGPDRLPPAGAVRTQGTDGMGDQLREPLSEREREILQLIAQGLSNREIGERLFLALDTVKGHNRRIFAKLQVQRRTEAIAKARFLRLLPPDLA